MSEQSNYLPFRSKLDSLCEQIYEKIEFYSDFDPDLNMVSAKIVFLGLNLYPNGIPLFPNYDILYIMNWLQRKGLYTRLHDPHIKGSEGLSMGFWLGRQSSSENWTHTYDVIILSCPHLFYIQNITKLAHMCKPNKTCVLLDLYGAFTRLYKIGEYIDIVNFQSRSKRAELMGGLDLIQPIKRVSE